MSVVGAPTSPWPPQLRCSPFWPNDSLGWLQESGLPSPNWWIWEYLKNGWQIHSICFKLGHMKDMMYVTVCQKLQHVCSCANSLEHFVWTKVLVCNFRNGWFAIEGWAYGCSLSSTKSPTWKVTSKPCRSVCSFVLFLAPAKCSFNIANYKWGAWMMSSNEALIAEGNTGKLGNIESYPYKALKGEQPLIAVWKDDVYPWLSLCRHI